MHVLRKTTVVTFASAPIDILLRLLRVDQPHMVGMSTKMCEETSAREAADRGFHVPLRNFQRPSGRVATNNQSLTDLQAAA